MLLVVAVLIALARGDIARAIMRSDRVVLTRMRL